MKTEIHRINAQLHAERKCFARFLYLNIKQRSPVFDKVIDRSADLDFVLYQQRKNLKCIN